MLRDIPANRYQSATEVLAALSNQKTIVIPTRPPQTSQNPFQQIFQFISPPTNPPKPPANTNLNINPQSSFTAISGKRKAQCL
jgi:hypothetical protein